MMSDKISNLYSLKQIKNSRELEDNLEYLRKTRNSSKKFMTRHQNKITPEMQSKWYNTLPSNITPYVFMVCELGVIFYPCGYGVILVENDVALLTGVIDKAERGQGFGRKLFLDLIEEAKTMAKQVCLEVLETNNIAIRLYESLGFVETSRDHQVITMELKK